MNIINFPHRPRTVSVTLRNPVTEHVQLLTLPADYDQIDLGCTVAVFANAQGISTESVRVSVGSL